MPRRQASGGNSEGGSGSGAGAGAGAGGNTPSQKALQEKLLSSVYHMYTNPSRTKEEWGPVGLEGINKAIDGRVIHPRRKIVVMIMGNHSAGKSSLVNWYVDEEVQKTGVAVETQGFTVVTSGSVPNEFRGAAALRMVPHIAAVVDKMGPENARKFTENLTVVVSTSRAKHFQLIDFIDTPGLVDGETEYPFDVNQSIAEVAAASDCILTLLDPLGKALCSRTMAVIEDLNRRGYHGKMRYFLSKADTVKTLPDLQKVIVQITQNLTSRVPAAHGFNVPTIWLPDPQNPPAAIPSESNELGRLCNDLVKTIKQKVQSNMTVLHEDASASLQRLDTVLKDEAAKRQLKSRWSWYRIGLFPLFPLLVCLSFLDLLVSYHDILWSSLQESELMQAVLENKHVFTTINYVPNLFGVDEPLERLLMWLSVFFVVMLFYQFFGCRSRGISTRSKTAIKDLEFYRTAVGEMMQYGEDLHNEYARSSQAPEYDFK